MTIRIPNAELGPILHLLEDMALTGAQSRARTKVATMIAAALESLAASEYQLVTEHAASTDDGRPDIAEDGTIRFPTPEASQAFLAARAELLAEQAELSGQTYQTMAPTLYQALTDWPEPLSGQQARAYDQLCDALEAHLTPVKETPDDKHHD